MSDLNGDISAKFQDLESAQKLLHLEKEKFQKKPIINNGDYYSIRLEAIYGSEMYRMSISKTLNFLLFRKNKPEFIDIVSNPEIVIYNLAQIKPKEGFLMEVIPYIELFPYSYLEILSICSPYRFDTLIADFDLKTDQSHDIDLKNNYYFYSMESLEASLEGLWQKRKSEVNTFIKKVDQLLKQLSSKKDFLTLFSISEAKLKKYISPDYHNDITDFLFKINLNKERFAFPIEFSPIIASFRDGYTENDSLVIKSYSKQEASNKMILGEEVAYWKKDTTNPEIYTNPYESRLYERYILISREKLTSLGKTKDFIEIVRLKFYNELLEERESLLVEKEILHTSNYLESVKINKR